MASRILHEQPPASYQTEDLILWRRRQRYETQAGHCTFGLLAFHSPD